MGRARITAFVSLLALVVAGCGSRVVPLSVPQVVGTGPFVNPTTGETINPTVGPTTGTTNGPVATPPVAIGNPNCVPGAKPTDTGVTKDTIKLGLIASITGPLPGQFNAAVEAVDTYFRMVNALGGICKRRVQLIIRDDNGDGRQNERVATKLATEDKVFAFVGSLSAPNDKGIGKLSRQYKIPDIGFPLTYERTESPYSYGVPGQLQRRLIGVNASGSGYLNKQNGVKQIAIFWLKDSLVSVLNAWAFESAMQKATGNGLRVCHEQETGILDNNFKQYVVRMQSNCDPANGPVAVYSVMENNSNIKLAQAMHGQGFKPKIFAPTFSSYLPSFIQQGGQAVEGAYIAMPQIPFERCGRDSRGRPAAPCSHPELNRYVSALQRYRPNYIAPGSWGAPGWGQAELFTQAAAACGATLTRACVLKQLNTMGLFSSNGFLSPTRPRDHVIYAADLVVQVRGGKFVEIRPTDKGGPPGAPDFWDRSVIFDWQDYYCNNKPHFPNTDEKDQFINC
ncbi:MAG: ABC transporter substrate-binding protein [Actinomycetota bacterium]